MKDLGKTMRDKTNDVENKAYEMKGRAKQKKRDIKKG